MTNITEEQLREIIAEELRSVLLEKCWPGYEKKGMKTMFGKRYPNCVKKEEVEVDEMYGGSSTAGRADRGDEVGRRERIKQAQA